EMEPPPHPVSHPPLSKVFRPREFSVLLLDLSFLSGFVNYLRFVFLWQGIDECGILHHGCMFAA
ncbi:hypothetical protein LXA55_18150, partial [Erwinia amylovora]|nr:hypothetical protein [Erwinia amylovora]